MRADLERRLPMSDDTDHTLGVLIRTMRYSYTERRLCCPECGGRVWLRDGRLWCVQMFMSDFPSSCEWQGERLAELEVRP